MAREDFLRWSGAAAMLGGALWVVATVIHAAKPRGCIGAECASRPMRESGPVDGILMLLSLALVAVGVWGVVLLAQRAARFQRAGKTGIALAAVGAAVLVVVSLVQAVFFDGDFSLMPYFVIPGVLALIAGLLLLGMAILRSGVLPRWTAGMLIVGALAMLGFNEQTAAVLLALPLGIAWTAPGLCPLVRPLHTAATRAVSESNPRNASAPPAVTGPAGQVVAVADMWTASACL